MLARTAARQTALVARPKALQLMRSVHIDNSVHNNMPFDYRNKKTFGVKLAVFFATGFSIPFVAVKYQLWKAQGGAEAA